MVQGIKNYADGLRKGLGIVVKCKPCGKSITYRALDFKGVLKPGDDIEERLWRCRHCGTYSEWIRYVPLEGRERESLAQWTPPYTGAGSRHAGLVLATHGGFGHLAADTRLSKPLE